MNQTTTSKQVMDSQVRRLKAVRITAELLLLTLQTSPPRVIRCKGVPPDAKAVRIGYDAASNSVIAVYEHPSFPECKIGAVPAFLEPRFTAYFGEAAIEALTPSANDESEQSA